MNKRFIQNIAFDVLVLWPALYFAVFGDGFMRQAGENVASFLGVVYLSLGLLGVIVLDKAANTLANKQDYSPRSDLHKFYGHVTSIAEVVVAAALGWWWVAAGFLAHALYSSSVEDAAKKIRASR